MEGRQVGKAVMFKGTVDLGKNDGGVFDWIGRANDKEFIGFFTSAFYRDSGCCCPGPAPCFSPWLLRSLGQEQAASPCAKGQT